MGATPIYGIRYADPGDSLRNTPNVTRELAEDVDRALTTFVESLTDNPTLATVLAAAIADLLNDERLVRRGEPGLPRFIRGDHPDYAVLVLSRDWRIIGGIRRHSLALDLADIRATRLEARTFVSGATRQVALLDSSPRVIHLTRDWRRAHPGAGADGLIDAAILDELRARRGLAVTQFVSLAVWGDSMSTAYQGGVNQTTAIASLLGVTGLDRGRSSDTPEGISMRMGARPFRVTVAGGSIPASGAVTATIPAQGELWGTPAYSYVGTIATTAGVQVPVIIRKPENAQTFTIEQSGATSAVDVRPGARFSPDTSVDAAHPALFWVGRNRASTATASVRLMLAAHRDPLRRRLVLPIFNNSAEPSGSSGYTSIMATNAETEALEPAAFFDHRRALIANGLAIAGIAPTAADTEAINADVIPPSLSYETTGTRTHLNAAGRNALARIVTDEIRARRW
ncbi:hypothetical protein HQQ81_05615 [Microbacteriaceae bacterium VKM Ac-2854]|nr:hypothetical protein [Microbacteriaceae bacterium VKM Ac-2854]